MQGIKVKRTVRSETGMNNNLPPWLLINNMSSFYILNSQKGIARSLTLTTFRFRQT
jgi:hypothetical protein